MKTTGWTAFGAGFFFAARLAAVADGAPLAGKLHAPEKGELASLERLVPRLMKDADVPGLSLAVVQNGQVVYRRALPRFPTVRAEESASASTSLGESCAAERQRDRAIASYEKPSR